MLNLTAHINSLMNKLHLKHTKLNISSLGAVADSKFFIDYVKNHKNAKNLARLIREEGLPVKIKRIGYGNGPNYALQFKLSDVLNIFELPNINNEGKAYKGEVYRFLINNKPHYWDIGCKKIGWVSNGEIFSRKGKLIKKYYETLEKIPYANLAEFINRVKEIKPKSTSSN